MGGSDYKEPLNKQRGQIFRAGPKQVREKLFGGPGPIPNLEPVNTIKSPNLRPEPVTLTPKPETLNPMP